MCDGGVLVVVLVEGIGGGTGCECGEGASGVRDGDVVGVGVESVDEGVEFVGELCDVDEPSEGTAIDGDGCGVVDLQDNEVGEVAGERPEDDGRAYLWCDEEVLAVVELGGTEADTGDVDVSDGDGACDAVDGFYDALQDGGLLGYEGCDGIAELSVLVHDGCFLGSIYLFC